MKHTTLLSIYKIVLNDSTITHNDFVRIVEQLKQFNGKAEVIKQYKKVEVAYKNLVAPRKVGRPKGSKNKPRPTKNHIVAKEPFETYAEFKKREKEENGK